MANITKTRNRGEVSPWREFFDIENFFNRDWPVPKTSLPAVNVSEDDKYYMVDVVAPGFKKDDFKVNVEDNTLTISAESKHESTEENKQYNRREYSYSSFTRSFSLPENAKDDNITANYMDGILKLSIPKTKTEHKPTKEIKIS